MSPDSKRLKRKIEQGWTIELHDMASSGMMEKNWPTASTSDAEGGRQPKVWMNSQGFVCEKVNKPGHTFGAKLRDAAEMGEPKKKKLNPDWVEQLMGLPVGHTQLSDAAKEDNRIDRIRLLGNGVVEDTAERAFSDLLGRIEVSA